MAIAIRPIPVLTGSTAERFETMMEENKNSPITVVPTEEIRAMHEWMEYSKHIALKFPQHI